MDRDKALEMAIGQIEKQFGKGSVMRMGETAHMEVEAVPTGALALDLALGVGGLPRGRVVEIFGPESSGKCLTADAFVWTDQGLETVAELFDRCGQPIDAHAVDDGPRVTPIGDLGVRAVNEHGELESVAALTHNARRPVVRLRLESGREVSATHNHPFRVVGRDGHVEWREAGTIRPGDVVVSAAFGAVEAAGGDGLSEDEAVLLGYLVAGSWSRHQHVSAFDADVDVAQEFTRLARQLFDGDVDGALRARVAEQYGLGSAPGDGRAVPACVRTGGAKAQRAFLSALFEADGWVAASSTVGMTTASEPLARQVQLLLYGFGIPCAVRAASSGTSGRDYWSVSVDPAFVQRFLDEVGFRSPRRQGQVTAHFRQAPATASATGAGPAADRHTYEAVVAVEDGGVEPTFDLVLPASHSFVANGILSHNTTLAMHVVAEAQRNGGICAYIDAEHAVDPVYARAIGVNVDDLLISQPDTGEQALEIADMLVRSGALDVVVVDSVAALTPRAEIEGEMGDSHVGLQARLMSQALRKLTATLSRANTIAIFINQLREKIGVMYGCMSYGTRVTLADGSQEKIGKIVNQRLPVEVLSYDPEVGAVVPNRVVNWFDNGRTDQFLQFTVAKPGGNGRAQFACTPNHLVRTPGGWREAGKLAVGDRVLQAVPHRLSGFQWEVVRGGLMGDSCLSPTRSGHGASLRFGHGAKQVDYCDWKASLFANIDTSRSVRPSDGAVFYDFTPLPELAELRRSVYVDGKKVLDDDFLKHLTPLALAIWYQDDGSFSLRAKGLHGRTRDGSGRSEICVEAMSAETRQGLVAQLRDTWGIGCRLVSRGGTAVLVFAKDETAKLHALIAPFVHPSMDYKLLPKYRGRFAVEPVTRPMRYELVPMPITKIAPKPPTRSMHRFDIEVEGSHNYLVDGVVVHNSPEVTPGGRALKFYSSVRLDIRRIESIKDGVEVVGNRVRVKVVKNKCAAPFKQAEFDIAFGKGISREGSLLDVGVDLGLIKKSGAWYTYDGEQLGQGRENAKNFLTENPEIMVEISERVRQAVGIGAAPPARGASDDAPITLE